MDDDYLNPDEEKSRLQSLSKNPAFDFLNDPDENIYSLKNGEPFDD